MSEMPKTEQVRKGCVISLMFSIDNDSEAMAVKQKVNEIIKDIPEKKFTFQIIES